MPGPFLASRGGSILESSEEISIERIVTEYRASRGQGWGAIAKRLGIKPGSPEFHALKQGRINKADQGASNGRGRGNGPKKAKRPR